MRKKSESLVLGAMFKKLTAEIGATIIIEPKWGMVGQITFKSGKKTYFRYNTVDLNPVGSSDIAKDKDYANFFMAEMGYPIVPGSKTFFSDSWAKAVGHPKENLVAALKYGSKLGFPLIVKPNSGSQGTGVALVHTQREMSRALRRIFKNDRVALVQKPVPGRDYRLVVLDKEVISAYRRIPLNVVGNGRSTVAQLLDAKQRLFIKEKRDTQIDRTDPRIKAKLARQKLSLQSVLAKDQQVFLLDNANLSTGGESADVTETVHPFYRAAAIRLTREMGLRLCGVDLMVEGSISAEPTANWWVLEINAAPGLDHYAKMGADQEAIVENLYRKVLQSLDR